jgi:hypothetical protein
VGIYGLPKYVLSALSAAEVMPYLPPSQQGSGLPTSASQLSGLSNAAPDSGGKNSTTKTTGNAAVRVNRVNQESHAHAQIPAYSYLLLTLRTDVGRRPNIGASIDLVVSNPRVCLHSFRLRPVGRSLPTKGGHRDVVVQVKGTVTLNHHRHLFLNI